MKNKLLFTTKELFDSKHYTIPKYQRGYKWKRDDIFKLLEDLKDFERSNEDNNSFYCLQNITIVPLNSEDRWNVVDGQQRLTTLYILLSYLRRVRPEELTFFSSSDCLKYNVRQATGEFLKSKIYTGEVWNDDIEPDSAESKDKWYILDVARAIKEWFDNSENELHVSTITERLKLIVNNMTNVTVSEEEIFAGLNGGKVDLDGADLVRAVLITRSAKEKYNGSLSAKVNEFRMRIALELDEMNLWWVQTEQKRYFEQFLPNNMLKTVTFNHDIYPIGLLYKLYYQIYHSSNEKFGIEFFEDGRNFNGKSGDDHWELYDSILHMHHTLKKWFNDPLLYHWIGYLIFRFKERVIEPFDEEATDKSPITINFKTIWKIWEESKDKQAFLGKILYMIMKLLPNANGQLELDIKDVTQQWYGKDPDGINNILVLMDIMICTGLYRDYWKEELSDKELKSRPTKIKDMKPGKTRLRSAYFTKYYENFEHIRSCAPNPKEGKEEKSKDAWIKHISDMYGINENVDDAEKKMRDSLLSMLQTYTEDTLSDSFIERLNKKMNEYGQHSIGNMALLDEHVNKSYGNLPFQEKIQRIFCEYMNNERYIRPYTMMVFEHKIKDSDKVWRWTQNNINDNAANIANNINTILKMTL